ncbi:MAG: hypothetical protein AAGA43_13880 [Bacteroidota bacterium]
MKNPITVLPQLAFTRGVKKVSFPAWVFLFFLFAHPERNPPPDQEEITKVRQETLKAFQLISNNLQRGLQAMEHLEHFEATRNKIVKP